MIDLIEFSDSDESDAECHDCGQLLKGYIPKRFHIKICKKVTLALRFYLRVIAFV